MTTPLSEDDLYRTSTQYRLWSFSSEQLAARRAKTHELALARARQHASRHPKPQQQPQPQSQQQQPEYLTAEEELRLVRRYCELIHSTSAHLRWPASVEATAIQYLKRFYLQNSCMTYPPKEIYKTALFLASKTEAIHVPVGQFAEQISADPEAVLAPEYKLMQALRFTLDIRQPSRGLRGVVMELYNVAAGLSIGHVTGIEDEQRLSAKQMQEELSALKAPSSQCRTQWKSPTEPPTPEDMHGRVKNAFTAATTILEGPASITDAYFLYTPSQILLAAMRIADEPLTSWYLNQKIPLSSPARSKILATIESCAELLSSFDSIPQMTKDERAALEKKLDLCRDPTTKDLIKSHAAMKRNGAEDGKIDEQEAKRRKLERQKSNKEMDDLFGPSLPNTNANGNG